jgi:Family of unknown function (DUF5709)
MSVDPGAMESGSDPQDALMDPDEETTLEDNETFDDIDEDDDSTDPKSSIYDTSWVPDDRPRNNTDFGNTLSEMREGESLDQHLAEEEPDVLERELGDPLDQIDPPRGDLIDTDETTDARAATAADLEDPEADALVADAGGETEVPSADFDEEEPRAGRLVEPDEGLESDTEGDLIAYDAGISGAGASAEEAAVHITDEP